MFNFTKKHSKVRVDIVDINEQFAGVREKYDAAIKKIQRLEDELNQKTYELNQSNKAQSIMSEGVKKCVISLHTVQNQLQAVATHLDRSNKHIFELIQKNKILKSSGDEWFRRAIKLEFDVLMAKDGLKKIEHERDLALNTIEHLQAKLMSTNNENSEGRNQG